MSKDNPYRLPRQVLPRHYDLELAPDLEAGTFDGRERITVEVVEPTGEIWMNSAELTITEASAVGIGPAEIQFEPDTERVRLGFSRRLEPGALELDLVFAGVLNDKLRGFYRSTYTGADGTSRTLATTQFESTSARRAFPCFDEPDLKATFSVELVVADGLEAISCGPETSREALGDGRIRISFAETMVMSTYLLAFVVGELEVSRTVEVDGVPIRVVHVPGKGGLVDFALDAGAFALEWLADYYGIPYPADKLDLVAIPDFAFGAMENLGCVTFRETVLLADPDFATEGELTRVADVISHELAHMWFGDLVTMKWWNGIWLKEAFATFMEIATVDAFRPDWHRWDQFGLERAGAFDVDALTSTRPIEYPVRSPADAEGMYDILTYEKGAAVLRMLERYLGEERYQAGIRRYLEDYSYSNTENTDLWDSIEAATGEPVRSVMDSWIDQGGHPLVTVAPSGDTGLRLSQRRFAYSPEAPDARWHVPVLVRARAGGQVSETRLLLSTDDSELDLGGPIDWAVVNSGGDGFYRTQYDPELRLALVRECQEILNPLERHNLVDDTWASVVAGSTSATEFLALVEELGTESDLGVWRAISGGLTSLSRAVPTEAETAFAKRVANLSATALGIVGYSPAAGESPLTRQLRGLLLELAGDTGRDPAAQAMAAELWSTVRSSPGTVDANLAAAAAAVVAAQGDSSDYADMVAARNAADTPQDEVRYLNLLGRFPGREEMDRTLAATLTDEVRTQNAPFLISQCLANRDQGEVAWRFVSQHWDELVDRFPSNSIVRMVGGIRALTGEAVGADVEAFFDNHEVPAGQLTLAQHLEKRRVNAAMHRRVAVELG